MFDAKKAAEFYVVAWCKNWTVGQYMRVVTETEERGNWFGEAEVQEAADAFPWLPRNLGLYMSGRLVRSHTEDNFPKLADWLWARPSDADRLRCAPQIERLRGRSIVRKNNRPAALNKDYARQMQRMAAESAIKKSNSRSAWSVCK